MPFRRLIAIAWLSFALLLLITNAADAYPTLVARDGNLPPCSPSGIKMLIPSPLHRYDKTLFATTKPLEWPDQPLLRSTDNGATWTPIAVINGMTAIDLEFSLAYAADHTLYMSLQEFSRIARRPRRLRVPPMPVRHGSYYPPFSLGISFPAAWVSLLWTNRGFFSVKAAVLPTTKAKKASSIRRTAVKLGHTAIRVAW